MVHFVLITHPDIKGQVIEVWNAGEPIGIIYPKGDSVAILGDILEKPSEIEKPSPEPPQNKQRRELL